MSFFEQGEKITLKGIHATYPWTAVNGLEMTPISHDTSSNMSDSNNNSKLSLGKVYGQFLMTQDSPNLHNPFKNNVVRFSDHLWSMFSSLWYGFSFGCIKMKYITKGSLYTITNKDSSTLTICSSDSTVKGGQK